MNTNTNNAAMDGRFPQFHGGQGLVSGYGGLAGNMQALQNLQGAAAAGYGLQTQIQAGRPGFGSMPPSNQAAQQRMGLNRNLQLSLGQAPRVALNPQQTQQQYGLANLAQRTQQQQQPGAASQAQLAGLGPTQLRGLAQQGAAGPVNGLGAAAYSSLALLHQQQQQAQRSVPGSTGPSAVNRGLGARLGMLGGATGNAAGGLAPGTTGYSAPSGDLLSMLSKAAASQGGLGLGLGGPGAVPGGEAMSELAGRQPAAFDASSTEFPSLGAPTGARTPFGEASSATAPPEEEFPALPGSGLASSGAAQQQGPGARTPAQQQQSSEQAQVSERYGLLGLTSIIRAPEAEASALVLGFDLTSLGLSLNQAAPIWKDFSSPFAEGPAPAEQEFQVPACYQHNAPRLTPAYFGKLLPDTLFYIFYGMPGDEAQVLAAEELTQRGWYFHKELKAWLTAVPNTEPSQKTDRFERGSFFVFDPASWEVARRDNFVVQFEHLERSPPLPGRQPVST